ncbi:MAG: hypothetical protein AB7T63_10190 [Planctomycetota bacterium]
MVAHALASLRFLWRAPMSWGLSALGVFLGWVGVAFAVLALHDEPARRAQVVASSAALAAAMLVLWSLARLLAEDRRSGFALAADAAAPGPGGRVLGRWLGCTVGATMAAAAASLLAGAVARAPMAQTLYLCCAYSVPLGLLGAWATLLAAPLGPGRAAGVGAVLFVLGHLPWGRDPLAQGALGRGVGALLPRPPLLEAPLQGAPAGLLASVGLALLAALVAERVRSTDPMI